MCGSLSTRLFRDERGYVGHRQSAGWEAHGWIFYRGRSMLSAHRSGALPFPLHRTPGFVNFFQGPSRRAGSVMRRFRHRAFVQPRTQGMKGAEET